jgi:GTP-binding protein LepA
MNLIRNFAIIAHIDHGKSTLADRLLEITGILKSGSHETQYLDRNPISRERGITIKLAPVRMQYVNHKSQIENNSSNPENSKQLASHNLRLETLSPEYTLNLIDTPGHVDFSYEVDRTLSCVEGAILLVDATQGVQAQTIANAYKAIDKNLVIIPAVNKIDMPGAEIEKTKKQLTDFLGVDEKEVHLISAKTGKGVEEILQAVIEKIPAPLQNHKSQNANNSSNQDSGSLKQITALTQSLIFDSYYDQHRGVIAFVRNFCGQLKKGLKVKLAQTDKIFEIIEVGIFSPELQPKDRLDSGEIGYVVTNLKDIHQVQVGDTIIDEKGLSLPLSGYKKVKPMVFASMFTTDTNDYLSLKKALDKLYLNDSSLEFKSIYSQALGAGFRVGFLGLLHADVVRERLEREFNLSLVLTPPQVEFRQENGQYFEPYVKLLIVTPNEYLGAVMQLCENFRGKFLTMDNKSQITLVYEMPMSEMVSDFYDTLKSVSSGYASLDWEFLRYQAAEADKLVILLNGDPVEEFSETVVKSRATEKSIMITKKLREIIPRQQYEVKIQAQFKGKIIASERIAPFRKDVLIKSGKVIGAGDVGRKRKLLEKQKEGKKKLKMIGKVEIPKEAFFQLFKRN